MRYHRKAFSRPGLREPSPVRGLRVLSISGERLGTIADVRAGQFLLDDGAQGHWLSRDAIFTAGNDVLTLICEREGLGNYAQPDGPGVVSDS